MILNMFIRLCRIWLPEFSKYHTCIPLIVAISVLLMMSMIYSALMTKNERVEDCLAPYTN